jgi:hypothetical protein
MNKQGEKSPRSYKALATGAAVVALLGIDVAGASHIHTQDRKIVSLERTTKEAKNNMVTEAQRAVSLHEYAVYQANTIKADLNATINNPAQTATVGPLRGQLIVGPDERTYTNPFLLALNTEGDANPFPDSAGNFLVGSWLGIQEQGSDGLIDIKLLPYQPGAMHFEASTSDPEEIMMPTYARVETYDNTNGPIRYVAYETDKQGQFLKNDDGQAIPLGYMGGLK